MKTKCIAIIPARGGSKRIPKKNIKKFFGKPLIAYSIKLALKSKLFDKVIVSTDDLEIKKISESYGAIVPFIRPKKLSDDFSTSGDAVNHAIEFLENNNEVFDYVCTIYATAPMLQEKYLRQGYDEIIKNHSAMAFSVTSMPFPIQRTFKINENNRCEMFTPEHFNTRSQDFEEAYQDAGQFYWNNQNMKSEEIAFGKDSIPILLPRYLVQDIDTLEDWKRAELMYQELNKNIYDNWNSLKKVISNSNSNINIKTRNIYLLQIGKNIGVESYGKGNSFLRLVLVYKKLGHNYFLGIPLSSGKKSGNYFFNFRYKQDIDSSAMLNQLKVFDTKRILKYHGKISNNTFNNLKTHIKEFFDFSPQKKEGGCQRGLKSLSLEISDIIPKEEKDVK